MKPALVRFLCFVVAMLATCAAAWAAESTTWPVEKALHWQEASGWLVGANFVPSSAINQLEMWQADTFDPEGIDRELGWAAGIGMNTMRVFLHDIPWREDAAGYYTRIDRYLEIAEKHGIRTLFVIFDGVWNPEPKAGKQPAPRPGVHNSGWVQSPGKAILNDPAQQDALQPYVQGVIRRYAQDRRVLMWDLFNEPENVSANSYGEQGTRAELAPEIKEARALELLEKTFRWAREANPSQPLTVGVWSGDFLKDPSPVAKFSLENSDVISFHSYNPADPTRALVEGLQKLGRPVVCTEYMSRGSGSTFDTVLPVLKELGAGAYNWGLVAGKSQTIYPWDSWEKPYTEEPEPWFHDVFRKDGAPYRDAEAEMIRKLTGK